MSRDVKQCDVGELKVKSLRYRLLCTSEAVIYFIENIGALHDRLLNDNTKLIHYALECECALINLQKPLRKPGFFFGLPKNYWD